MNRWQRSSQDWDEIHRNLLKQIPFAGKEFDGASIENYVHRAVKKAMAHGIGSSSFSPAFRASSFDCEVFETHRSIFVQCRFPEGELPKGFKLFASRTKLKLEAGERSETVSLPGEINPSRTLARFRGGILEVRLPKSGEPEAYREIFVREGESSL